MCGEYPIIGACCLPCPMADWVYPDYFKTFTDIVNWICVVGTICCVFLLLSWAFLPVEKTNRHYLSISLTTAVLLMNVSGPLRWPLRCWWVDRTDETHSWASCSLLQPDPGSVPTPSLPTTCTAVPSVAPPEPSSCLVASLESCGYFCVPYLSTSRSAGRLL